MPRAKKAQPTGPTYPIDEHRPMRHQSVAALMNGEAANLITYRKPYDLSQDVEREALRAELGPAAVIPDHTGVVYLLYVIPEDIRSIAEMDGEEPEPVPVLLPEGHVVAFMLGLAIADSVTTGQQFTYRPGLLPLHDLLLSLLGGELDDEDEDDQQ